MKTAAKDLNKILGGAQLPALPQSAIKLLELSHNPKNGPAEFAVPIETDPGLTSQILRFVNSSYFGFAREISSVKLAITLVGIRTIKNFALWSAVFSLMPNPKCGPFDLRNLWQDSLRRGLFARGFAKMLGVGESEDAFAAGLLQDLAIPLLAKELPNEYGELLGDRDGGKRRLTELEQERFGWNHAEAAGIIAKQWKFPEAFVDLLREHHLLEQQMNEPRPNAAKIAVSLSSLLPSLRDETWHDAQAFEQAYQRLRPAGGPSITEMLATTDKAFEDFAPLLKLPAAVKPLSAWYAELTAPVAV
jgi:HD-like signal output (HDOD) protein